MPETYESSAEFHLAQLRRTGASVSIRESEARRASAAALGAMRARLSIALVLMIPAIGHANPVSIDGQSLIAFAIVAFWALVIESGMVTLVLVSCGPLIVPLFGTLVVANVLVFLFAFLPLSGRISLWLLEPGVVLADALFIKLVASLPFVQGAGFLGVTWRRALVASLLGNTVSFFIGVLACGSPWIDHHAGGVE